MSATPQLHKSSIPTIIDRSFSNIERLSSFIRFLEEGCRGDFILYRGQQSDWPLLPKICRIKNYEDELLHCENYMIEEFKREAIAHIDFRPANEWEWIALAQHHGLPTRFLDWSLYPLPALWFIVQRPPALENQTGVLWIYTPTEDEIVTESEINISPRMLNNYKVYLPHHVDSRIIAQGGVFTSHRIQPGRNFVPLEATDLKGKLHKILVHGEDFYPLRYELKNVELRRPHSFRTWAASALRSSTGIRAMRTRIISLRTITRGSRKPIRHEATQRV